MLEKLVVIFGASGRTGRETVDAALKNGFRVRAVVRTGGEQFNNQAKLETFPCDILREDQVTRAMAGSYAAIIVFGPVPPYKDIFCAKSTENIVKAMETQGVNRLICQTGAMIGDYRRNRTITFELMSILYKKQMSQLAQDRIRQEIQIIKSNLDWTIIKPPRLTDSITGQELKVGTDLKVGMFSSVSRKSLADFLVVTITNAESYKKILFVM